jgi:hypothetical protein
MERISGKNPAALSFSGKDLSGKKKKIEVGTCGKRTALEAEGDATANCAR